MTIARKHLLFERQLQGKSTSCLASKTACAFPSFVLLRIDIVRGVCHVLPLYPERRACRIKARGSRFRCRANTTQFPKWRGTCAKTTTLLSGIYPESIRNLSGKIVVVSTTGINTKSLENLTFDHAEGTRHGPLTEPEPSPEPHV